MKEFFFCTFLDSFSSIILMPCYIAIYAMQIQLIFCLPSQGCNPKHADLTVSFPQFSGIYFCIDMHTVDMLTGYKLYLPLCVSSISLPLRNDWGKETQAFSFVTYQSPFKKKQVKVIFVNYIWFLNGSGLFCFPHSPNYENCRMKGEQIKIIPHALHALPRFGVS